LQSPSECCSFNEAESCPSISIGSKDSHLGTHNVVNPSLELNLAKWSRSVPGENRNHSSLPVVHILITNTVANLQSCERLHVELSLTTREDGLEVMIRSLQKKSLFPLKPMHGSRRTSDSAESYKHWMFDICKTVPSLWTWKKASPILNRTLLNIREISGSPSKIETE
jgi:hypothetical protein